jgi:hypothetical protein
MAVYMILNGFIFKLVTVSYSASLGTLAMTLRKQRELRPLF